MLHVDYDPRFVDFVIREVLRDDIMLKTIGYIGPHGERAIRRTVDEASPVLSARVRLAAGTAVMEWAR